MNNLKTSYIPNTFFSVQYFKIGETEPNLYSVKKRLKKIKIILLLTIVNCFCMGLNLPVSKSSRGSYSNSTCTLLTVEIGLTSAFSSSEQ